MRRLTLLSVLTTLMLVPCVPSQAQGRCAGRTMGTPTSAFTPMISSYLPRYYPSYYPTNYPYNNYYNPSYTNNYQPYANPLSANGSTNVNGAMADEAPARSKRPVAVASSKPKRLVDDAVARGRAEAVMATGDRMFGEEKYATALARYRSATRISPDLADAHLREGFALLAQNKTLAAVKAFRRGLEIRQDWSDSRFQLGEIYAKSALVEKTEMLSDAVQSRPNDANNLVALGMQLYFDGQRDQAAETFAKAATLGANDDHLLDGFLPQKLAKAPAGADSGKRGS
jgi:tetratricopeptide (TPR) repeat protein